MTNLFKKNEVKIEYDFSDNFTEVYDEAYGIAVNRKRLFNNSNYRAFNYVIYLLLTVVILAIYTFLVIFCTSNFNSKIICYNLPVMITIYLIFFLYLIDYLVRLKCSKCRKVKGYFTFSKEGLTDYTFKGIKITFDYSKLKLIVVREKFLIILTDSPIYFIANIKTKDEIIKTIKQYKDIKVIE